MVKQVTALINQEMIHAVLITDFFRGTIGEFLSKRWERKQEKRKQYRKLETVLFQIRDLTKEDYREAGKAAVKAKKRGEHPADIPHKGARVWDLHRRLQQTVDPLYPGLSDDFLEGVEQIDEWITKLNDGAALTHMHEKWVRGGAGEALNELPPLGLKERIKHRLGMTEEYPESMDIHYQHQAEVKAVLAERQEKLLEAGYYEEQANEEENKDREE